MASEEEPLDPRTEHPAEKDDDMIFDAESDIESAGSDLDGPERTMGQHFRSLVDMGLLPSEVPDRELKKRSLSSTGLFRTLIDFVRPGVEGKRINPLKRADHRISCPHCGAVLTVPKQAIGRQVLCLQCERLIEHTDELVVAGEPGIAPAPPAEPPRPAPGDSTPGLQTIQLSEDAPAEAPLDKRKWKDWDKVRKRKRERTGATKAPASRKEVAKRTQSALARYRERSGLSEKDPMPFVGRPVGAKSAIGRPWVVFVLVLGAAGLAAGATALAIGGRTDDLPPADAPAKKEDPAGPEQGKIPVPRELDYMGYVPSAEGGLILTGRGAGCRFLTRDKVPVWVLLSEEELASLREALRDPRSKVCIRGRGVLYAANHPDALALLPPGIEVRYVLADGPRAVEIVAFEEYLHTPSAIR